MYPTAESDGHLSESHEIGETAKKVPRSTKRKLASCRRGGYKALPGQSRGRSKFPWAARRARYRPESRKACRQSRFRADQPGIFSWPDGFHVRGKSELKGYFYILTLVNYP